MSESTQTNLSAMRNPAPREQNMPVVTMGFGNLQSFELMQRAAKMLAHSTLVPVAYRAQKEIKDYGKVVGFEDNPNALPNCVVALNMSQRMGADPLMVMQNLYIVEGRPSWSSQFIIAAINSCGRYSPLRFQLSEPGESRPVEYLETKWVKGPNGKSEKQEVKKTINVANRTCIAWAIEKDTGERLESPVISMEMAVAEGWLQKNGSKWQTMPEVMLRYRSAAFFGKLYAPELLMGLQTAEEAVDIIDFEQQPNGGYAVNVDALRSANSAAPGPISGKQPDNDGADEVIDQSTGEVTQSESNNSEAKTSMAAGPATDTKSPADTEDNKVKAATQKTKASPAAKASQDNHADSNSYNSMFSRIKASADTEVLDLVTDEIRDVPSETDKAKLYELAKQRRAELEGA